MVLVSHFEARLIMDSLFLNINFFTSVVTISVRNLVIDVLFVIAKPPNFEHVNAQL